LLERSLERLLKRYNTESSVKCSNGVRFGRRLLLQDRMDVYFSNTMSDVQCHVAENGSK
jgi:hypothetical protein